MKSGPPPNPERNDVWIDDVGEMRYFNGSEWLAYEELPDLDLDPLIVEKGVPEEE